MLSARRRRCPVGAGAGADAGAGGGAPAPPILRTRLGTQRRLLALALAASLAAPASSWEWDYPPTRGTGPGARRGATLSLFEAFTSRRLVLAGGYDADGKATAGATVLNPADGWNYLASFSAPRPRADHVAALVHAAGANYLVLAGGSAASGAGDPYCDVVLMEPPWAAVPNATCVGAPPVATWGASLTGTPRGTLALFGGASGALADPGDDSNATLRLSTSGAPAFFVWDAPPIAPGPAPAARHYHAAAAWNEDVVVFGGVSVRGAVFSDAWLLCTSCVPAWSWAQLLTTGAPALYGHRAVVAAGLFVVYGGQEPSGSGVYAARLAQPGAGAWAFSVPPVAGGAPRPGIGAAAAVLMADGESDPNLLVYGGSVSVRGAPTSGLAVLTDIGVTVNDVLEELPYIAGGVAGGLVLLFGLAFCAWRRQQRPAGLSAQLAGLAAKSYAHVDEEEEAEAAREALARKAAGAASPFSRQPPKPARGAGAGAGAGGSPSREPSTASLGGGGGAGRRGRRGGGDDDEGADFDGDDDALMDQVEGRLRF